MKFIMTITLPENNEDSQCLVVRNVDRINEIFSRTEMQVIARIKTWQVGRIVRREYYYVTAKLFLKLKDRRQRETINDLMGEFVMQTEFLKAACVDFPINYDLGCQTVPLRIVCREAFMLYKTLMDFDEAVARLHCAQVDQRISADDAERLMQPVMVAFCGFKGFVENLKPKSSTEIAQERGLM